MFTVSKEPLQRLVMLAGDVHGDVERLRQLFSRGRIHGVERIIQLGDFGLWPGSEESYIHTVSELAEKSEIRFDWLDGNHENHDYLDILTHEHGKKSPIPMTPWVRYLPRGCRLQFSDLTIGILGGAYSIDRGSRILGRSFWTQETTTLDDLDNLGNHQVDILLTHDSPELLPSALLIPPGSAIGRATEANRKIIRQAIRNTNPKKVIHGHWHMSHDYFFPYVDRVSEHVRTVDVYAVADNQAPVADNYVILDVKTKQVLHSVRHLSE